LEQKNKRNYPAPVKQQADVENFATYFKKRLKQLTAYHKNIAIFFAFRNKLL